MSKTFILPNVRASFVSVFEPNTNFGTPKYEITGLVHKTEQADLIEEIKRHITAALLEKFGSKDKIPPGITSEKNCCLRDGDNAPYDGYAGHMSIKASNDKKPITMNQMKEDIDASSGLLYSGSYVDLGLAIWVQDNKWGKKVNCNLLAVRHRAHGEAFGGGAVSIGRDAFEDIEPEDMSEADLAF